MKSLKEQADLNCTTCKGSGQDTTTTGYTGVCECVGLHDAGIEPSGQGEETVEAILDKHFPHSYYYANGNNIEKNKIHDDKCIRCEYDDNLIEAMNEYATQQTALLSRQLLRSEQKNQAKDEEIQRLRKENEELFWDGKYLLINNMVYQNITDGFSGDFEADCIHESVRVLISKKETGYFVANAMDGWGNNALHQFNDAKIILLTPAINPSSKTTKEDI